MCTIINFKFLLVPEVNQPPTPPCVFQVLASLRILLTMKPVVIHSVCKQISFGLHDLLKTNAANIHSTQDWFTLFTLLEVAGAGINPPPIMQVNSGVDVQESISEAGRRYLQVL